MSSPTTTPTSSPSSTPSSSLLLVGDLDSCLELVSEVLVEDLFGVPAEERESGENVAKIPESKSPQSYNSYELVARYLSPKLLPDLLSPVKEVKIYFLLFPSLSLLPSLSPPSLSLSPSPSLS